MKALVCQEYGSLDGLRLADLKDPSVGPGEALVSVSAAALCFPDILLVQGQYQTKIKPPFIPGNEIAGRVSEIGAGVKNVKVGDVVFGRTAYAGGGGGFAEKVSIPSELLWKVPGGVDPAVAAAFALNYATSLHGLRDCGHVKAGETLLVLGAGGGVGLAAVELGKMFGAQVIACASSSSKLDACKSRGADHLVNYETDDLREAIKRITGNKGVDVIFDPVGGRFAEPAMRGLAWQGRYLVVGFTSGDIPKLPLNLALLKAASIIGVYLGGQTERNPAITDNLVSELLAFLKDGKLHPLLASEYTLDDAKRAFQDLRDRKVSGKAVVTIKAR